MRKKKPRRVTVLSEVDKREREANKDAPVQRSHSSVLPTASESESAGAWHDGDDSNDARLLENLPPHWGRQ
ncbi:hypothetical protein BSZ39_02415 [Bowdeniella nasicola]|uniref:Uncharacterized protein n=1 Tax=Bowdeniella nasicola TaxID=208480 RepID=A0A1Q5Q4M3_9ACTO|nr:hypothetical protein [Bowdeniella nasicola]OKL54756.1 hypothetical protein BSZ39_02415 [Bowdeniella nasicola]